MEALLKRTTPSLLTATNELIGRIQVWKRVGGKTSLVPPEYGRDMYQQQWLDHNGRPQQYRAMSIGRTVTIIGVTHDKKVILVGEFFQGPGVPLIALPGGGIKRGESATQAATRELLEETGYSGDTVIDLGDRYFMPRHSPSRVHVVLITNCRRTSPPTQDPDEDVHTLLADAHEWFELCTDPEHPVVDQNALSATLLAFSHLGWCKFSFSGMRG